MKLLPITILLLCPLAWAQEEPSTEEQQSLMIALTDGQTSPMDMIRALEGHLSKFPSTSQLSAIQQTLAKAALEIADYDRLVKYGEPLLQAMPDDVLLLDRLAFAMINHEDKALAERGFRYGKALEEQLGKMKVEPGRDAAKKQEDLERTTSRALLYQARARSIAGNEIDAAAIAARAFALNPSEEAAREWAENLQRAGLPNEAIERLAEAFVVSDPHTSDAARLQDRKLLGEWYRKQHGSEAGLGDVILSAYDRMAAFTEARNKRLQALEPNAAVKDALDFTLTGLSGKPFRLANLKGYIVVMDFWATWCAPCRVQHPLYETLKERFPRSSGVVFLGINADEDRSVVEPFLDEQKWDKEVFYEDGLARLLNVMNIPATILFDRSGQVASRMDGFDPSTFLDQMTARIQSMLAAK